MNFNGLFTVEVIPTVVLDGALTFLEMCWPLENWCLARSSRGVRAAVVDSSSSLTTSTEVEVEAEAEAEAGVLTLEVFDGGAKALLRRPHCGHSGWSGIRLCLNLGAAGH